MSSPSNEKPASGENWDAIVIGSGIGGLAVAALLSSHAGKRVLVLERHYVAGGYTHAFHRKGYEWDVGLHYVGEVREEKEIVRRAFDQITEGRLQWASMPDVYDRIVIGDRAYEFPSGIDRFRSRLKDYFPNDATAVDHYLAAVRTAQKASAAYFAEKAIPRPLAFLIGSLLRRRFLRWGGLSTAEVLDRITQNRELKGVLTAQWGNYGLPPAQSSFGIHAIIASHYFEGAAYPVGGAGRIAETIAPLIEQTGGRIVVNAEVAEVMIEGKRAVGVRTREGQEFRAPLIISDVGARATFERLLPRNNPMSDLVIGKLQNIPPSSAHLCLYVGVKESASKLGINGSNLWVHPSFDHDANFQRFSTDPGAPFPLLFISFPSAKDPDFEKRHPERATIEVLCPAPWAWFERWESTSWRRRGEDYEALKREFSGRLQGELVKHVPALAGKIDYAELSTPLSTRHFMNHQAGEMYGLSATPGRFRLRCLTPRTPIRGLYLTGQDVTTLGVTGALFGGVVTASAILRRNLNSSFSSRA